MSKTDWGKLQNLIDPCEKCKKPFPKAKLIEYKEKMYCELCLAEIKANEKINCDACGEYFQSTEITEYYKKNYCSTCLKKEKEERKKKSDEHKTEEKSTASSTTENYTIVAQRIQQLEQEQVFLKELILKQSNNNVTSKQEPMLSLLLIEFSRCTFDSLIQGIKKQYDLIKYDVPVNGEPFFWDASNFKTIPEIWNDNEKRLVAQFLNRLDRGDRKKYALVHDALLSKMRGFIEKAMNQKEEKKEITQDR